MEKDGLMGVNMKQIKQFVKKIYAEELCTEHLQKRAYCHASLRIHPTVMA